MKVFSLNTQLYKVTGIEKVMLDIHHAVRGVYEARIVGNIPYTRVNKNHGITEEEYVQLHNPFIFRKSIVIVHERRLLFLLWLLNTFFFQHIKIIYIHHSVLYGSRLLTMFPKNIVAISDSGVDNLINYFHVKPKYITKIHNCVVDWNPGEHQLCGTEAIKILYPARVNSIKRQIEIVDKLSGRIDKRLKILFVGDGPHLEEFRTKVQDDDQFLCLGYRNDVLDLLRSCDYLMLFSTQEGLPITLIEATMSGTPIICNNVGGNEEIAFKGKNAFVAPSPDDYDWLVRTLNSLPNMTPDRYKAMSRASRMVYEKYFTFEGFQKKYLELLKSIQ